MGASRSPASFRLRCILMKSASIFTSCFTGERPTSESRDCITSCRNLAFRFRGTVAACCEPFLGACESPSRPLMRTFEPLPAFFISSIADSVALSAAVTRPSSFATRDAQRYMWVAKRCTHSGSSLAYPNTTLNRNSPSWSEMRISMSVVRFKSPTIFSS